MARLRFQEVERTGELAPPAAAREPRRRRWVWWRELGLVAVLYVAYDAVQASVTGSGSQAVRNGRSIVHLERVLHVDPELLLNHGIGRVTALAVTACYLYASLHFILTPAVVVWVCVRHQRSYGRARAVLAIMTAAALIGFWLFPTAPPRLLPGSGFQDTMQVFQAWGWWGEGESVPTAAHALANSYAAMPSLHVAWATWSGVTVLRLSRRRAVRVLALLYPTVMALVVMATANHYLLDVVAGVLLWAIVDRACAVASGFRRAPSATASSSDRVI